MGRERISAATSAVTGVWAGVLVAALAIASAYALQGMGSPGRGQGYVSDSGGCSAEPLKHVVLVPGSSRRYVWVVHVIWSSKVVA